MTGRFVRAALAVLVLSVSACGSDGQDESPAPAERPDRLVDSQLFAALPLERYKIWSDERLYRVRLAENVLVDACMRRKGVDWSTPPISKADPEFRRYGVVHADIAREFGYHPAIDPVVERRNEFHSEDMTARQRQAFMGNDGQSGCQRWAQQRLYRGVPKSDQSLLTKLGRQSLDLSGELPPVKRAKAEWSSCMKSKGHDYSDPASAVYDPAWNWERARPSDRETSVATADVACKREARLVETWLRAEAELQHDLIAKHARELERIADANKRLLANTEQELR